MRLAEQLPYKIRVGRRTYRLKPDFRCVLQMFDVLQDKTLTETARIYLACKAIVRHPPRDLKRQIVVFMLARETLLKPPKHTGKAEKVTDFDQDADMIRAAFRQAYGIDLFRAKLHWQEFTELLNNLPDGTRYANIIDIRAKPLPEATKWNGKQRQALIEAKMKFALDKTEDEVKKSYKQGVSMLANSLLMMANKGGGGSV